MRRRNRRLRVDKDEIVKRVLEFYDRELRNRQADREIRLQRYAKYRMWTEPKDFPWPEASNVPLPDMTEKSLRVQDTLVNAVMSQRPAVSPVAIQENDEKKVKDIEELLDYQFFVEAGGETMIGDLADQFVNDPSVTVFIPWVREKRPVTEVREFDPIPDEMEPVDYFRGLIRQAFQQEGTPIKSGWDFETSEGRVSFFTVGDMVEMQWTRETFVYDGPKPQVLEYDDVFYPPRSANLQPPSPSNPRGAKYVVVRSFPHPDEIKRLAKSGFYTVDAETLEALDGHTRSGADEEEKRQKDDLAGQNEDEKRHGLTRLVCFDRYDLDGDGLEEDVVWWVLKESKTLLKVAPLSALYPLDPPRRPLATGSFLPVAARKDGMSLLEMLDGLHDAAKSLLDQVVDAGTMAIAPYWFYRASGSVKPEIIRLGPGDGYPLSDPSRDIVFPKIGDAQSQAFGLNMLAMLQQMGERVSVVGDLQLGRVPAGKSSALRTAGGIALLSGQGEARPERILRRFFGVLVEVWAVMHELNQSYLPKKKQFRMTGYRSKKDDPYREISDPRQIGGRFHFGFSANVLNISKQSLQQNLMMLSSYYISNLALQLGIIQPDGAYRFMRDLGEAFGQDPDKYLSAPHPNAMKRPIIAEEAIGTIISGGIPDGTPMEGAEAHLQRLIEFSQSDEFGLLDTQEKLQIFKGYVEDVREQMALEVRQARLAEAAGQMGGMSQGGPEAAPPDMTQPQVQGGELLDESLPGAGGGANG